MTFSMFIAMSGVAIVLIAGALVWIKKHRPEIWAKLTRKKTEDVQKEPTLPTRPPIVDVLPPQPSPAPVAPVPPTPPMVAVGTAVSGTPQRTTMAYRPQFPNTRPAPAPTAIQMLRNFKQVAALAQAFLDCPNEIVKYCLYREEPTLRSIPRELLGVSAGWINACDADGLLDNVSVHQCNVDAEAKTVSINGAPPVPVTATSPTQGWATADGHPPDFYQPLGRVNKSGADIVAEFLRQATTSSYLRGLGLTEEAIAAARVG